MFHEILGILIDQNGNFLSFGKLNEAHANDENAYLFFHGRALMAQIYFHQWYQTHPDLGLEHFDFANIFSYEPEKEIDYDIYSMFPQWSALGYCVLFNGSHYDDQPIVIGYVPKRISNEQASTLFSLKEFISLPDVLFSELYRANGNGDIFTLEQLFQEVENQLFGNPRTLR